MPAVQSAWVLVTHSTIQSAWVLFLGRYISIIFWSPNPDNDYVPSLLPHYRKVIFYSLSMVSLCSTNLTWRRSSWSNRSWDHRLFDWSWFRGRGRRILGDCPLTGKNGSRSMKRQLAAVAPRGKTEFMLSGWNIEELRALCHHSVSTISSKFTPELPNRVVNQRLPSGCGYVMYGTDNCLLKIPLISWHNGFVV